MGKIIFKYHFDGTMPNAENKFDSFHMNNTLYDFKQNHGIDILQTYEFAGTDDFTINIDLSEKEIDLVTKLPDETSRQILTDILRYRDKSHELKILLSKIEYMRFANRHELYTIGNNAMDLIRDFEHSDHFDGYGSSTVSIAEISHTLNQEVSYLLRVREKDSGRKKEDALRAAVKHLHSNISSFQLNLDHIRLIKNKKD